MDKKGERRSGILLNAFLIVVAFVLGGTGLAVLFNAGNDLVNIIVGFVLIGIAVAIVYKLIEYG